MDKYCQGYIGILRKNHRYKQYIKAIMKPGGIRPMKKNKNFEINKYVDAYGGADHSKFLSKEVDG